MLYTCLSFSILIIFIRKNFVSSCIHTSPSGFCPIFFFLFISSLSKGESILTVFTSPTFTYHLAFHPLQSEFDSQKSTETTLSKYMYYLLVVRVNGLFLVFIIYDLHMAFDIVALDYTLLCETLLLSRYPISLFFFYLSVHFLKWGSSTTCSSSAHPLNVGVSPSSTLSNFINIPWKISPGPRVSIIICVWMTRSLMPQTPITNFY